MGVSSHPQVGGGLSPARPQPRNGKCGEPTRSGPWSRHGQTPTTIRFKEALLAPFMPCEDVSAREPMSIDKLAPQAVEAEQSVLGSILIDPEAILKVAEFLHPPDFYRQQHADIYEAMLGLHGQREANDAEAAIDRAEGILFEISQRRTLGGFESLATLLGQAYDRLEYLHEHRGQILGIPSGLSQLDALLGGFQPSDLIILAARPSVGKSSLALNIAQHAAVREGKKVGIFSLEMSKEQIALRLLSAESGINPRPLQSGFVDETDWTKIAQVMNEMHSAPMWIDDSPVLTVL